MVVYNATQIVVYANDFVIIRMSKESSAFALEVNTDKTKALKKKIVRWF